MIFFFLLSQEELEQNKLNFIIYKFDCQFCQKTNVDSTHFSNSENSCKSFSNLAHKSSDEIAILLSKLFKFLGEYHISNFEKINYTIKEISPSMKDFFKIQVDNVTKHFEFSLSENKMSFKYTPSREILKIVIKISKIFQNIQTDHDLKTDHELKTNIQILQRLLNSVSHEFCNFGQCISIFDKKTCDFVHTIVKILNFGLVDKLPSTECFLKRKNFTHENCPKCNKKFENFIDFVKHSDICCFQNPYIHLINTIAYKSTVGFKFKSKKFVSSIEKVDFNEMDYFSSDEVKNLILFSKSFIQKMPNEVSLKKKRKNENNSSNENKRFAWWRDY